jgi:hypothetical protein
MPAAFKAAFRSSSSAGMSRAMFNQLNEIDHMVKRGIVVYFKLRDELKGIYVAAHGERAPHPRVTTACPIAV